MDKKNGEIKQDQYLKALIALEYVFEGAMTPYLVLKETARRMKDTESLEGLPYIEIGLTQRSLSDYAIRTFKAMLGENWQEGEIEGVPYKIQIIKGHYKMFDHPDTFLYYGGAFSTGNPWDNYWRGRFIIK